MDPEAEFNSAHLYEAYKFYEAEVPGEALSWVYVERCRRKLSQSQLDDMVFSLADRQSAASQYEELNETLQSHVDALIYERSKLSTNWCWTCAACYYHETDETDDSARNYLFVILLGRRIEMWSWPTSPMGVFVDTRSNESPSGA